MTKKLFINTILFFTFVLGGIFLNSCSDLSTDRNKEILISKIGIVNFAISEADSRTVLPNSDEQDLKKYLYLYNYSLTYAGVNEEGIGSEKIICNDFSYEKFCRDSNVLLATGKTYKFTLKAKDGAVTRMEGSSTITLSEKPTQTVTIVLTPTGEEYGQKLRVDWIVPDDGIITRMKAGISDKRGYAEYQTEEEILDPDKKYRFQEYVFSVIDNPFEEEDPHKTMYGSTVKRIGVTYDNVKTGVPRWLDYKFYDANGILVYESSESVYMIGGKTSSTVIYITPDYYYRRPVIIPVYKDGLLWANNSELEIKLIDKNGNEYIFKPVYDDEYGKPTGEFEGFLPGKSSGVDSADATDGIFDIYVGLEDNDFIKTGAEYNANTGKIKGNGGEGIGSESTETVELITVPVPDKGITLTPSAGVVGTGIVVVDDGSGESSEKVGLIVPAGQDFTVQVKLELGYKAGSDGITVCGKPVADGETVTLNTKKDDLSKGIKVDGVDPIEYTIVYKSDDKEIIAWNDYTPTTKFTIESNEDIELPKIGKFKNEYKIDGKKIGGWWFGSGTVENNLDNIIHKINAEKAVKEKLIQSADENNKVVLNVYWIEIDFVEYKIVYEFEDLDSDPVTYSEDKNIVSFHNVAVKRDESSVIEIPQVPGFTAVEIKTGEDIKTPAEGFTTITLDGDGIPDDDEEYITKEIHYKRNEVTITLWSNPETSLTSFSGQYGKSNAHHVDDPVLEDHRFLGWYVKDDESQPIIKHFDNYIFPAKSVDYVAKWEQTQARYTVEFWYETEDSTESNPKYEKTSTYDDVKGAIGSFPAFNTTPKESGFTYKSRTITAGEGGEPVSVVTKEGNTLVKLYFDRKTVTFTLKANGGKFTDGHEKFTDEIILEGKYGTDMPLKDSRGFKVEVPQPPVLDGIDDGSVDSDDFEFIGWHVRTELDLESELPEPFKFPAENKIYAARWNPLNGTYKVVHWAESMDKYENSEDYKLLAPKAIDGFKGQMLDGSVTKKGKLGLEMKFFQEPVKGFEDPEVEYKYSTGTITADGNAEVIVTYRRKKYEIFFHLNAGGDAKAKWCGIDAGAESSETVKREGKYRIDFTPPENPVRTHFVFRGWTTKEDGTLEDRVDIVPSFTEEAPKNYYAVWYSKASGGLVTDTADITLECDLPADGTIRAEVDTSAVGSGDWNYIWTINSVPSNEISDAVLSADKSVLTLSNCLKKDYEITVVATLNGKVYTKTKIVTVK